MGHRGQNSIEIVLCSNWAHNHSCSHLWDISYLQPIVSLCFVQRDPIMWRNASELTLQSLYISDIASTRYFSKLVSPSYSPISRDR